MLISALLGAIGTEGGTFPNEWNKFVPKPIHTPPHPGVWQDLTWPLEYPLAQNELSFLLPHLIKDGRGKLDTYFTRVYNPVWTNPDGLSWMEVLTDETQVGNFVALTRGSPRIFDGDDTDPQVRSFYANSDLEDTPVPAMTRKPARNHQRGYFDLGVAPSASGVRRTPPGSPFGAPGSSPSGSGRTSPAGAESSIPAITTTDAFDGPKMIGGQRMWRVPSGGSEDSTPSSLSNDESSRSSSPDGSPYEGPISLQPDHFPRSPSPGDKGSYDAFLNRYVR